MAVRRDVARNRERIVRAAAAVFRRDGVYAPLDGVAADAGVGRATLYRHFPDRGAVLAAVLEDRVDALEAYATEHPGGELLEHLVVEMSWFMVDMHGLMSALATSVVEPARLEHVAERSNALLGRALADAVAAGRVREGTTLDDVLLVTLMAGALTTHPTVAADAVGRAMEICFDGLRPGRPPGALPRPELR